MLVQVETADVYAERMEGLWPVLRDRLRDLRDQVGTVRRLDGPADELHIRVGNPAGVAAALEAVQAAAQPVFSLTGGSSREFDVRAEGDTIVVTLTEAEKAAIDERTMQQSLEIIRRRVDETGTREPSIQRQGADRILVQVPGIGSAEELLAVIGKTAQAVVPPGGEPDQRRRHRAGARPGGATRRWTRRGSSTCSSAARWSPATSSSTRSRASTRTTGRR